MYFKKSSLYNDVFKNSAVLTRLLMTILILTGTIYKGIGQPQEESLFGSGIYCNTPIIDGHVFLLMATHGTDWVWTGPNSFVSTDKIIYIPDVDTSWAGLYTLQVYDSNSNQSTYYDTLIDVIYLGGPNSNLTTDEENYCEGELINASCNVPGSSYTWSTTMPGTIVGQGTNSVTITAVGGGVGTTHTIYVTVYDGNNNEIIRESRAIYVLDCCIKEAEVTLLINAKTSDYPNGIPTGYPTVIGGSFTVDSQFDWPSGIPELYMLGASSVFILPGSSLSFNFPTIIQAACRFLWHGFQVLPSAYLKLENCTVRDAVIGIRAWGSDVSNTPTLKLVDNLFTDNHYDIELRNYYTQNHTITQNVFTSTNHEILPFYPGTIVNASRQALRGFSILNSTFLLQNASNNIFSNIIVGITSSFSYIAIEKNAAAFIDLHPGQVTGSGSNNATSVGCRINMGLFYKEANDSWLDDVQSCDIGYDLENTDAFIEKNRLLNTKTGIYAHGSCPSLSLIKNHIECSNYGIKLINNPSVYNFDISKNEIYLDNIQDPPPASAGISVFEPVNLSNPNYSIHENYLYVSNARWGIDLLNVHSIDVHDNYVYLLDAATLPNNHAGINVTNSISNQIYCNHIYGSGSTLGNSNHEPFGIKVTDSRSNTIKFNTTDNTFTGIGFEGSCLGTDLNNNGFGTHDIGVIYFDLTYTDPQYLKANYWTQPCSTYQYKAFHTNSDVTPNRYTIGANCSLCDPTGCINYLPWFDPISASTPVTSSPCIKDYSSNFNATVDSIYTITDSLIATGNLSYPLFDEESQWAESRYLLDKVQNNLLPAGVNQLMDNFYDSIQGTSMDQYNSFSQSTLEILPINPVSQNYTDSLYNIILQTMMEISMTDSLLSSNPNFIDSLLLTEELVLLNSKLGYWSAQLSNAKIGLRNIQENNVSYLSTLNGNLPDTAIYEFNEKTIHTMYLNGPALGHSTFTSQQENLILSIASQCPVAGGPGVYYARGMYALIHDTLFDDKSICLQAGILKSAALAFANKSQPRIQFRVFPNPATKEFTVSWDKPVNETGRLTITDLLGTVVLSKDVPLEKTALTIDASDFKNGVYLLRVLTTGAQYNPGKLVIVK
jgi:hypothetical protein